MQTQNYKKLMTCYAEWLTESHYTDEEIVEMIDRVEEFFDYMERNEHSLTEVNEDFMSNYYQDKLFEENLHTLPEKFFAALNAIGKRQSAMQAFSRFLRSKKIAA
ncbi:MAG: hypothetical protein V1753_07335 [Pseudomonadota bacterium]